MRKRKRVVKVICTVLCLFMFVFPSSTFAGSNQPDSRKNITGGVKVPVDDVNTFLEHAGKGEVNLPDEKKLTGVPQQVKFYNGATNAEKLFINKVVELIENTSDLESYWNGLAKLGLSDQTTTWGWGAPSVTFTVTLGMVDVSVTNEESDLYWEKAARSSY